MHAQQAHDEEAHVQRPLMALLGQAPQEDAKGSGRRRRRARGQADTSAPALGVSSLVLGLAIATGLFALYSYALYANETSDGAFSAGNLATIFGYTVYAGLALTLVGAGLGIAGLFQRRAGRVAGLPGIAVNVLVGACVLAQLGVINLPINHAKSIAKDTLDRVGILQ